MVRLLTYPIYPILSLIFRNQVNGAWADSFFEMPTSANEKRSSSRTVFSGLPAASQPPFPVPLSPLTAASRASENGRRAGEWPRWPWSTWGRSRPPWRRRWPRAPRRSRPRPATGAHFLTGLGRFRFVGFRPRHDQRHLGW